MTMGATGDGGRLLGQVREGMTVRDASGKEIGTVRAIRMGDGGDPADADRQAREAIADVQQSMREPERPIGIGNIAAVGVGGLSGDGGHPIGPLTGAAAYDPEDPDQRVPEGVIGAQIDDDELPESGRDRLIREGYIRIDSAGFFAKDRYAAADQIAQVANDGVHLRVASDALLAEG